MLGRNIDASIPPEASGDGRRNAFYTRCVIVGHSRPYAMCLRLCDERKEGRLEVVYSECSAAIGKRECPALGMRKEEHSAGHAIYFLERSKIQLPAETPEQWAKIFRNPSATIDMGSVRPKSAPIAKPTPVPLKRSVIDKIDDAGYAKAITRAIAKEMPKVAPPPKVEPKAGESLLEMARRMMGK